MEVLPQLRGAFSLTFMDEDTLYAARDPQGVRPLVLGRLERGWVVASETAALDIVGASVVREVEPGELIAIDENGLRSQHFAVAEPKGCVFEYVYLARPDTTISGRGVHAARVEIGRRLAKEHPVEADLVIPVPESGTPAAVGYAEASGIPYGLGLVKNSYVGRTFIQPSQTIRQLGIRLKLNPLRDVIRGKRLVVVDDSIVRGNTQRALIRMLREAGAVEVHVRIASPPVKWPCFYGIDFASRAELVANGLDVDGVRASINADSLGYVSEQGLIAATEQPASRLCTACFTGQYPIPLGESEVLGKHVLEGIGRTPLPMADAGGPGGHRLDRSAGRQRDRAGRRRGRAHAVHEQRVHLRGLRRRHRRRRARRHADEGRGREDQPARGGRRPRRLRRAVRPGHHEVPKPLLASSTDGVGTKIALARQLDRHDTVGIDLVAMVVDDLVACGAEPLFLQDYVACGKVVPERIAAIVTGIAAGCTLAGAALVGGETAEHGDLMDADEYDLAATAVGRRRGRRRPGPGAGDATATSSSPWRRPGSTPTATRWSAGS